MPGVFTTLRTIPWKQVLGLGSALLEASREAARERRRRRRRPPVEYQPPEDMENGDDQAYVRTALYDLRVRLDLLENDAREQSSLISQLTEVQIEISAKVQFLNERITTVLLFSIGIFLILLIILIKMFLR